MKKIGICGFGGRMGQTIFSIIQERQHNLAVAFDAENSPFNGQVVIDDVIVTSITEKLLSDVDSIIDFSAPSATRKLLDAAVAKKIPVVIGTTGFSEEDESFILESAKMIPIFWSPNMSVGVNLLFKLVEIASKSIPTGYDIEIFEAHHRFKKDAPSGTAAKLYSIVRESCDRMNDAKHVTDRNGIVGERSDNEIGMQVMRGGDIVGEHTVFFAGIGERIELTHRATDRRTFAEGAVTAAEFISDQKPGLYTMSDLLGL